MKGRVLEISSERRRKDSMGRDRVGDIPSSGSCPTGGQRWESPGHTGSGFLSCEKKVKAGKFWGEEHGELFLRSLG